MRNYIKKILIILLVLIVLYFISIFVVGALINTGITNAESTGSNISGEYQLPYDVLNNKGVKFVLDGIENRKQFLDGLFSYSKELGLDSDLVLSCILAEQIRIATKGVRGNLKDIILYSTPTLFRSFNVSLGIGGIKETTARQIKKDAIKYGYGESIKNDIITSDKLSKDDRFNAKYSVYLVRNIIDRRYKEGYDITNNPGVICTLYNMGNDKKKTPHKNPKIGGAIISINGKNYTYGEIGLGIYNYLKFKQSN